MTNSYTSGDKDAVILIYDSDGNQPEYLTWGGTADEIGKDILVLNDDIYVCGRTYSFGIGSGDCFIVKYNAFTDNNTQNIPGFELPIMLIAITCLMVIFIIFWRKCKLKLFN